MSPLSSIVLADGLRCAYRFDGPPDAPLLMLSNSLGTTLDMWHPQVEALRRSFRILRYDTRGHGASAVTPAPYALDTLGRDALHLMDALGLGPVDFCGLSLGGMIGQWLGAHAPERLSRLVLCNTSPHMGPPAMWQARIDTVLEHGMTAMAEPVLGRWFTPAFRAAHPDAVAPVKAMLLASDPVGYAGCCAAIRDMDMRPLIGRVRSPALVIGGAQDAATPPSHARALAEAIAGARLVILETAHLSNIEAPDAVNAAIAEFLAAA